MLRPTHWVREPQAGSVCCLPYYRSPNLGILGTNATPTTSEGRISSLTPLSIDWYCDPSTNNYYLNGRYIRIWHAHYQGTLSVRGRVHIWVVYAKMVSLPAKRSILFRY